MKKINYVANADFLSAWTALFTIKTQNKSEQNMHQRHKIDHDYCQ